ncbi:hypothetical protein VTH82DRAFT_8023 [Thermothelomyces myriococcoides]
MPSSLSSFRGLLV